MIEQTGQEPNLLKGRAQEVFEKVAEVQASQQAWRNVTPAPRASKPNQSISPSMSIHPRPMPAKRKGSMDKQEQRAHKRLMGTLASDPRMQDFLLQLYRNNPVAKTMSSRELEIVLKKSLNNLAVVAKQHAHRQRQVASPSSTNGAMGDIDPNSALGLQLASQNASSVVTASLLQNGGETLTAINLGGDTAALGGEDDMTPVNQPVASQPSEDPVNDQSDSSYNNTPKPMPSRVVEEDEKTHFVADGDKAIENHKEVFKAALKEGVHAEKVDIHKVVENVVEKVVATLGSAIGG